MWPDERTKAALLFFITYRSSFLTDRDAIIAAVKDVASFVHNELHQIDGSAQPFHVGMIDRRLINRITYGRVRCRPDA
jgi:hypothetical protein